MEKIVNNVVKCHNCSSYIEYEPEDIKTEERSYGVMTYANDTYTAKFVVCPKCGKKVEVYSVLNL